MIENRLQVIDLTFKSTGIVRISHDREFGVRIHTDTVFQIRGLIRVKAVCLKIMVDIVLVPETEETLVCLLEMIRNFNACTGNLHDRRIIVRIAVDIRTTVRVHIVIHGLGVLGHTEAQDGIDLGVLIDLKYAIGVQRNHVETVHQMTCFDCNVLGERLSAVFKNLLRADAPIYMRRKIVGDILTVRHSVVIGAELIVEPDIDRNTRIVAVIVRTARIVTVNILEHLNTGNIFRI